MNYLYAESNIPLLIYLKMNKNFIKHRENMKHALEKQNFNTTVSRRCITNTYNSEHLF